MQAGAALGLRSQQHGSLRIVFLPDSDCASASVGGGSRASRVFGVRLEDRGRALQQSEPPRGGPEPGSERRALHGIHPRRHTSCPDVRVSGGKAAQAPHSQSALREGAGGRSVAGGSCCGSRTRAGSWSSRGVRSSLRRLLTLRNREWTGCGRSL